VGQSATGAKQVSPIPARHQQRTMQRPASITLLLAEAAIIYFHQFTMLPPATHHKKAIKNNSK
jgi:hypothetical protein